MTPAGFRNVVLAVARTSSRMGGGRCRVSFDGETASLSFDRPVNLRRLDTDQFDVEGEGRNWCLRLSKYGFTGHGRIAVPGFEYEGEGAFGLGLLSLLLTYTTVKVLDRNRDRRK